MFTGGNQKVILFTVDVESHNPDHDENGALWIGDLLCRRSLKGTFFVAGEVVERRPGLVHSLLGQGHEIAAHGYSHRGYYRGYERPYLDELDENRTRKEIERSYQCIKENGIEPFGYRAPRFRIRPDQLKIVGEFFQYDSSLNIRKKGINLLGVFSKNLGVIEMPVSLFEPIAVPAGTPYLLAGSFGLWRFLEHICKIESPLLFYSHSFDFMENGGSLNPRVNLVKRMIYYRHCGRGGKIFIKRLLDHFINSGWQFFSCAEFLQRHVPN